MASPPTAPSTTSRPANRQAGAGWNEPWLAETLSAASQGHPWAREELAAHCLPQLGAFARARGAADPDGIADTVMVEFLGRLDRLSFDSSGQMWAYLYRIARSRIIDERRAAKPVEYHEQGSMEELLPPASGVDEAVTERSYVDGLLSSLTSDQREVLQMRFLDDLSIEETASRTGRTLTAVKGLQRRAIRALATAALLGTVIVAGLVLTLTDVGRSDGIPTVSEGASPSSGFSSDRAESGEAGTGFDAGGIVEPGDGLAPETVLTGPDPAQPEGEGPVDPFSATFLFEGADETAGIERFECSLDGGPFEPCTSPLTVRGLTEGGHLLEVRAVDRAGNVDPTPARAFWMVERPAGVPVGVDLAALQASTDVLQCGGLKGTWAELVAEGYDVMVGTGGDDVIDVSGGNRPDLVIGGDGNDTIRTGDGADRVCGGAGNDTISTGGGNDRILSGDGNDTIDAGNGNDRVWAGAGTDSVIGGRGDDLIRGEDGTDHIDGRQGADDLRGGDDPDVLIGGPGDDVCRLEMVSAIATTTSSADEAESDPVPSDGEAEAGAEDEGAAEGKAEGKVETKPEGDGEPEKAPEVIKIPAPGETVDPSCETTTEP